MIEDDISNLSDKELKKILAQRKDNRDKIWRNFVNAKGHPNTAHVGFIMTLMFLGVVVLACPFMLIPALQRTPLWLHWVALISCGMVVFLSGYWTGQRRVKLIREFHTYAPDAAKEMFGELK